MNSDGAIYLIDENGGSTELVQTPYDSEELLQKLLADHPHLLAGEQINPDNPRRWLLVSREIGVPDQEGGVDRWSLDHLFLDQDGIPTLVEVKRSSDTRIRREVVGQMLDYAANAVTYWPVDKIRECLETRCAGDGKEFENEIVTALGEELDPGTFWEHVETNLEAGRIRLVFLADAIPMELRRVVEYLNHEMSHTEVVAIEIGQYTAEHIRAIVPRLVAGAPQTAAKRSGLRGSWNEASFFEHAESQLDSENLAALRQLYSASKDMANSCPFGSGRLSGSFNPRFDNLSPRSFYSGLSDGGVYLNLDWHRDGGQQTVARDRFAQAIRESGFAKLPIDVENASCRIPMDVWTPRVDELILIIEKTLAEPNR